MTAVELDTEDVPVVVAPVLHISEPPFAETLAAIRRVFGPVPVVQWQPRRWVPEERNVTARLRDAIRNPRASHEDVDA